MPNLNNTRLPHTETTPDDVGHDVPMTRLNVDLRYPGATVQQVHTMLMTPGYWQAVARTQKHLISAEVTVTDGTVVVEQRQDAGRIPSVAKKLVGDDLHIIQTERWGATQAEIDVAIPGKPGKITGTAALREADGGVVHNVDLRIEVSIPLIGSKIAKLIAEKLEELLADQQQVARRWLEGAN
mgnify:CR=1 FL=1